MGFFKKEKKEPLTQAEYNSQLRALELEIARETKMLDLESKKADLRRIKAALDEENRKNSKFGKFFATLGELGGNMNANLDKEHKAKGSPINFNHDGLTKGIPGIASDTSSKKGLHSNPDIGYTGLTDGLPGLGSKASRKARRS